MKSVARLGYLSVKKEALKVDWPSFALLEWGPKPAAGQLVQPKQGPSN